MARPNDATLYPDFMAPVNLAGSFSELQKVALRKTNRRLAGKSVVLADMTAASGTTGTTFTDVPGMSFPLEKNAKYRITGTLLTAANAAGGVKVALVFTGQTAATPVIVTQGTQAAAITGQRTVVSGSVFAATADVMKVDISGFIQTDGRGKMTLQFAQNVANAAVSTLYKGSWLQLLKIG